MHRPNNPPEPAFGFLSTLASPDHGFFGGYLLINVLGRPLEFHCTAPVRPSRAQEILYGSTLQPYLLGEQIGGTLLREAQITPRLVLTDQAVTLCLRAIVGMPLVFVGKPTTSSAINSASEEQIAEGVKSASPILIESPFARRHLSHEEFIASGYQLRCAVGFDSDRTIAGELLEALAKHVDVAEPFDRIHEAIREAQRLGERSQESHDQAAA